MRIPPSYKAFGFSVTISAAILAGSMAQSAVTEPVGFNSIPCYGNSDTIASIPLTRPPAFAGAVASISGSTLTFSGTPFASAGQFKYLLNTQPNTYYVSIVSGTKEGNFYTITDNTTNSVTISLDGDVLGSETVGAKIKVIPYWTLGTAFPNGQGVNATTGPIKATQVFIPNTTAVGTNAVPTSIYYYSGTTSSWILTGQTAQPSDAGYINPNDVILYPDNYFTIRHNVATSTTFTPVGSVVLNKLVIPLATTSAGRQDNYVALQRPVPVTLTGSGLYESGAFTATSGPIKQDQLFVYDNSSSAIQKFKVPTSIYYYANGAWRITGDTSVPLRDAGGDVIFTPGTGVVIRKNSNAQSLTSFWVNTPTYTNN